VINQLGEPISDATLTILKGISEIASVRANKDGKFSFEQFEAGNYVIRIGADGYQTAQSPIVVVKPSTKCKRSLHVMLSVGMGCSGVGPAKR
jgi:hypothetical protein